MFAFLSPARLFLLLLVLSSVTRAREPVQTFHLDDRNFETVVTSGEKVLVHFFDDDCEHCPAISQYLKELPRLTEDLQLGFVDCSRRATRDACDMMELPEFPSLRLFIRSMVYTFRGALDEGNLTYFLTVGYRNASADDVNSFPTHGRMPVSDPGYVSVTDANISLVESLDGPVFIYFRADHQLGDRILAHIVNDAAWFAKAHFPNVTVAVIDGRENWQSSRRYGVLSFPRFRGIVRGRVYELYSVESTWAILQFLFHPPEEEATALPAAWNVWYDVWGWLQPVLHMIASIWTEHRALGCLTFGLGFISGALWGIFFRLVWRWWKWSPRPRRNPAPTPASNLAPPGVEPPPPRDGPGSTEGPSAGNTRPAGSKPPEAKKAD
eukprot:EG_transcript_12985